MKSFNFTGRRIKDGRDIAILSLSHSGNFVTTAIREVKTDGLNPAHYDMRFAKPLHEELLHEVFKKFNKIITVEDGNDNRRLWHRCFRIYGSK